MKDDFEENVDGEPEEGLQEDAPEEELFETTPEEATTLDAKSSLKPKSLDRKKLMVALCCSVAFVVCCGLLYSALKPAKKKTDAQKEEFAEANSSQEFLSGLRDRAVSRREQEPPEPQAEIAGNEPEPEAEPTLPPVAFNRPQEQRPAYQQPPQNPPPSGGGGGGSQPSNTHFKSSLVPPIQGSLFSQGGQQNAAAPRPTSSGNAAPVYSPAQPYVQQSAYEAQNGQQNKQSFYDPSSSGGSATGRFIGANSVWTGTIIPGVLETAINTDLPGNVLARVTQNIYDSRTGRTLLIPQGTILLARYNSSVSVAQKRIQIVWDTMIRPDGFELDLEGANGVDSSGMSGLPAQLHENSFEYLKAAGIITLFSYANAKMTDAAAKYADGNSMSGVAAANANFVNQLGESLTSRAANIQPTLTAESGSLINIMLNKTLYLPPVAGYPATEKYLLE